jgi:hypothetical protein
VARPKAKSDRREAVTLPGDPATAFEELRHDLSEVEAMAAAAVAALSELPYAHAPNHRRKIGRLGALVEATARAATSALDTADAALEKLSR